MSFEDIMRKRLADCGADACREVTKSMKAGRSLADAVLDAIEVLPASKTRDLRRWVNDWEAWGEWLDFEKAGWEVERQGRKIYVDAPMAYGMQMRQGYISTSRDRIVKGPSLEAIAAAVGVESVRKESDNNVNVFGGGVRYKATFEIDKPVLLPSRRRRS
jgi:hypothetical protein